LWLASRLGQRGPYQLEAAIHSLHADRARTGTSDWPAIHQAYRMLVSEFPSLGAHVGFAASAGRVGEASRGLSTLDALDHKRIVHYQPYWAVRAWLLAELGRTEEARGAYDKAIGLCSDPAVRRWLGARAERLGKI
jgi:RNA polymerase sigma-70 factor (ECF subfamily)